MTTQEILQGIHDWTNRKIVYDISVAHPDGQGNPTPYADLAAALGNGGANIPEPLRDGGMSVKFIQGSAQSSDNKYVQYRLTATSFSTTESDWQGVDEKPTIGSKNLVESEGVFESLYNTSVGTIKTPSSTGTGFPQITSRTINPNTNYTYAVYSIAGEDYIGIVPQNIAGIVAAGMGILFTNDLSDLSGARWRNYKELDENNVIDTGGYNYVIIAKSYVPNGTSYGDVYDANVDTKYQEKLTESFITPTTIVLPEFVLGTSYVIGNQVQDSSGATTKYYVCRKANNDKPLSNTTYWKAISFDLGGVPIQELNINGAKLPIYQQGIKITGFGTSASASGVTKIGEIYYNTTFHYLSKVTRLSPSEQNIQIPYYDGAIYNYNDALYVWNGSELINKTPEYIIDKKPIIASDNLVKSGGVASELYNTVRGDIKTPYTTGTGFIQITTHSVNPNASYNYAVYDIDGEDIISIIGYFIEQNPSLGIVFTNDSSLSNLTDARWVAFDELDANGGIAVGDYHYVAITKTYIPNSVNFGDVYDSSIQSKFMPFAENVSFVEGGIKSNGYLDNDGNNVLSVYAQNNKRKHLSNSNTNCPIVIFSYDDNTEDDDTLVALADARGLKCTFACQGFNVDVYPTQASVLGKKLYRWAMNGHGTLGHGITGGTPGLPGAGGLNNMCDADCYKQIIANNKFFDTFGLSHKGIVYFNTWEHNPHTISIVGQYYDYGIISGSGMITPDVDLYKLTRYVTDSANMLTNAKKLVDSAIGKNCIISFGGHMNRTGTGGSYSSMADFTELLDYIAEKVSNHQMISLNVDDAVELFSARNAALGGLKSDKQYNPATGQMCLTANGLEICTSIGAYAIFDIAISGTVSAGVIQFSNIPTYANDTYVEVTLTDESTIADVIETFKKQVYKNYTLVAKDATTMRLYANSAEYRSTPAVVENQTSLEFTITRAKGGVAPTWLQLGGN